MVVGMNSCRYLKKCVSCEGLGSRESQHQPVLAWVCDFESGRRFLKGRETVVAVTEESEGDEREGGKASGRTFEGIEAI
jgi:hypothetical protein